MPHLLCGVAIPQANRDYIMESRGGMVSDLWQDLCSSAYDRWEQHDLAAHTRFGGLVNSDADVALYRRSTWNFKDMLKSCSPAELAACVLGALKGNVGVQGVFFFGHLK